MHFHHSDGGESRLKMSKCATASRRCGRKVAAVSTAIVSESSTNRERESERETQRRTGHSFAPTECSFIWRDKKKQRRRSDVGRDVNEVLIG